MDCSEFLAATTLLEDADLAESRGMPERTVERFQTNRG